MNRPHPEIVKAVLSRLPQKTTQDEWAELHPHVVQWFTDDCPLPLCRYRNSSKPRHHHLIDTLRHYERAASSDFPFMAFYRVELHNAARSERRRIARRNKK